MLEVFGKLTYLVLAVALVWVHMSYVHRAPLAWTRNGILFQLVADLAGFAATWRMLEHLGRLEPWIRAFLIVHVVIHAASLLWACVHWRSLEDHMRLFQSRKLNPVFAAAEFLYEQSDTALYLMTIALVVATVPASVVIRRS